MTINRRFVTMIATFAVLSIVLELIPYHFAAALSGISFSGNPLYAILGSYSPAAAAVLTALLFHKDIRAFGWGVGKGRYYLFALFFPVLFYPLTDLLQMALGLSAPATAPLRPDFPTFLVLHFIILLVVCLGEEIGWRGFLVPQLMKGTESLILAGLISALIWAVWHFPTLIWRSPPGVPLWLTYLDFTIGLIGISFVYLWLRLASGSLWPCFLLHTVSDWIGSCWEPLYVTQNTLPGTGGIVAELAFNVLLQIVMVALVVWYMKRNPVMPGENPPGS